MRDRSRINSSSHHLSAAGAAILDLLSDEETSESSSGESEEHSDYEPAVKHSVTTSVRELPSKVKVAPVERVKHGAGYNYGVPGTLFSFFFYQFLMHKVFKKDTFFYYILPKLLIMLI